MMSRVVPISSQMPNAHGMCGMLSGTHEHKQTSVGKTNKHAGKHAKTDRSFFVKQALREKKYS